ncbi:hypothetical protein J6590_062586 [Homalodisca vitripennis]|nr:hypothetical protein J6590_062586 [Homalodisca vitripennis]
MIEVTEHAKVKVTSKTARNRFIAERLHSYGKQPACPTVGVGSEVTFNPLVLRCVRGYFTLLYLQIEWLNAD